MFPSITVHHGTVVGSCCLHKEPQISTPFLRRRIFSSTPPPGDKPTNVRPQQPRPRPATTKFEIGKLRKEARRKKFYNRNRKAATAFYIERTEESILENVGLISEMSLPFRNSAVLLAVGLVVIFASLSALICICSFMNQVFPRVKVLEMSMLAHLVMRCFEKGVLGPFMIQMYYPICCMNEGHKIKRV